MAGAITGDGEGTGEKEEGERQVRPLHVGSPPTFQPWLRLRSGSESGVLDSGSDTGSKF